MNKSKALVAVSLGIPCAVLVLGMLALLIWFPRWRKDPAADKETASSLEDNTEHLLSKTEHIPQDGPYERLMKEIDGYISDGKNLLKRCNKYVSANEVKIQIKKIAMFVRQMADSCWEGLLKSERADCIRFQKENILNTQSSMSPAEYRLAVAISNLEIIKSFIAEEKERETAMI